MNGVDQFGGNSAIAPIVEAYRIGCRKYGEKAMRQRMERSAAISNPMVMGEFEPQADAILAEFGVSTQAVLDVVFGDYSPTGRLPMQLPKDMATVEQHREDVAFDLDPYVDEFGNRYDYGFGLNGF